MADKKRVIIGTVVFLLLAGAAFFVFSQRGKDLVKSSFMPDFSSSQRGDQSYPSRVLDLTNWKLTLPVTSPDDAEQPLEIKQPKLETYQMSPWFTLAPDKKGVIFRAPVDAQTTANSSYPRSELREMTDSGKQEISWSTTKGTHTLFLDEAITAVPQNKPEVVAGQIHGDDDDLLVIRLEGEKLYLNRSKKNLATLDENYVLGKRFTVKFVAKGGKIMTYYNDELVNTLEKKVKQAYFKVGVYTQSNCKTEESPDLCSTDNYGEVIVYQAKATHE